MLDRLLTIYVDVGNLQADDVEKFLESIKLKNKDVLDQLAKQRIGIMWFTIRPPGATRLESFDLR